MVGKTCIQRHLCNSRQRIAGHGHDSIFGLQSSDAQVGVQQIQITRQFGIPNDGEDAAMVKQNYRGPDWEATACFFLSPCFFCFFISGVRVGDANGQGVSGGGRFGCAFAKQVQIKLMKLIATVALQGRLASGCPGFGQHAAPLKQNGPYPACGEKVTGHDPQRELVALDFIVKRNLFFLSNRIGWAFGFFWWPASFFFGGGSGYTPGMPEGNCPGQQWGGSAARTWWTPSMGQA